VLFSRASTTESQIAVVNLSRSTLGRIHAVAKAAKVRAMSRTPHEGRLNAFMTTKVQPSYHALELSPQGVAQGLDAHKFAELGLALQRVCEGREGCYRLANAVL
jgi:hypothetical protein